MKKVFPPSILLSLDTAGVTNLLLVGFVHTGITYCLYFSSLKYLSGQTASVLSYIDPLVAVIVSVTLPGETITWVQIIGGALILGFALLNEIKNCRYRQKIKSFLYFKVGFCRYRQKPRSLYTFAR